MVMTLAAAPLDLDSAQRHVATVLERISDAFFAVDASWRFTYVNQQAAAVLKQPVEALLGCVVWTVFPQALGTVFEDEYQAAMRLQQARRFEAYYEPLELWVEVNAYPGLDGLSVYFRDISDRKRDEEELWERTRAFTALAENSPDIISRFDQKLRFVYINAAVLRETGLVPDRFLGRRPDEVDMGLCPVCTREWIETLEQVMTAGCATDIVVQCHGLHGTRWYELRCVPEFSKAGTVDSVLAIARNVTAQHQAEATLRESEERFRLFVENASDSLVLVDECAVMQFVSPTMERDFGYAPTQLTNTSAQALVHPEDWPKAKAAIDAAFAQPGMTQIAEIRVRDSSGRWRPCEAVGRVADTVSSMSGLIVNLRDMTRWHELEANRRAEEARYKAFIEHAQDIISVISPSGHVCYVSPAVERVLGLPPHEVIGCHVSELVHPEDMGLAHDAMAEVLREPGRQVELTYRCLDSNGTWRTLETRGWNLVHEPQISGIVLNTRDVTERARSEAALRESEERFRALSASSPVGIFMADRQGRLRYANPRLTQTWGRPEHEVLNDRWIRHVHAADVPRISRAWHEALHSGRECEADFRVKRPDGSIRHVRGRSAPWRDAQGVVVGSVGTVWDVTEREGLERELAFRAHHDTLTGLENRARFREKVERAIALHCAEQGDSAWPAVLFIDLDDFKTVNDSLGHEFGDRLLKHVAMRLREATCPTDSVARLGGDEFAVLIKNVAREDDCVSVAQRIVELLREPFELEGHALRVGASVGIARALPEDTADDLLRNADLAMYRAKHSGKHRHECFQLEMHLAVLERRRLEEDLHRALANSEFLLHFQPIVEISTGRVRGAEALVRWRPTAAALVPPNKFIPVAEETGLIVPLGRWVLIEACRRAVGWPMVAGEPLTVTVNVSARQLAERDFAEDVHHALLASGVAAERLVLEITESVLMQDRDTMLQRLQELKAIGVKIAIDDFGTGFSSLAYLQRYPVDVLKIDKSFVDSLERGGKHGAITENIIGLAKALDMRSVAEGVETEAQRAELLRLGCRYAQGYLFARPMDHETWIDWLASTGQATDELAMLADSM
ncbi:PAS domain S-box protein [Azohydromonas aeria]|uniref:PAS domain S-box protein n=1 Tax=Azohydromonas aeria TaxID=2590212 RepID=UPI0012F8F76E|nr:EAL domain-containing protein [Azohydromonas aeria]